MQDPAAEIVSGMIEKWSACFGKFDPEAQASLYAKNAFFFGSNPTLYRGRDGVAAYFKGLPKWRSRSVQFSDVHAAEAGPGVVNMAAIASFDLDEGATRLSVKITWVIVREDGDWKIVNHHVSPRTPLI